MGPFGVVDLHAETHTPGDVCAGCCEGYPRPCPRVMTRTVHQGRWEERICPGRLHGERVGGRIEQRCDCCGVTR